MTDEIEKLEGAIKNVEAKCHQQEIDLGGVQSMLKTLKGVGGGSVGFLLLLLTIFWNVQNGNAERVRKLENAMAVQETIAARQDKKLDEILREVRR